MLSAHVRAAQVCIKYVGPDESSALGGRDCDVQEREMGATAAFRSVQVDEEGEEAHSDQRVGIRVLIVVDLARGVA